jgi:hypothetical protein
MTKPLKIDAFYAFVATDSDGDEGLTAFHTGTGWMPMVAADWQRVESLREIAAQIARESGEKVTLYKFSVREEIEDFNPS